MTFNLDPTTNIILGLIIWSGIFPLILLTQRTLRMPSAGLGLAYLALLFIGHVPGAFIYILPWYFTNYDSYIVASGFEISWLGVVAFSGAFLIGLSLFRNIHIQTHTESSTVSLYNPQLPWLLFFTGIVTYVIFLPLSGILPSLTSVVINIANLQIMGIIIGIWQGITSKNSRKTLFWLSISPLIPLLTVSLGGFLGYGIAALVIIAFFLSSKIRIQWWHIPVIFTILYIGMSLYITYINGRVEIREVVWGNEGYSERAEVINTQFQNWQWFDWRDQSHLAHIDGRLNQNFLTGIARLNLENHLVSYSEGETIRNAFIALVPRIIWPEKPIVAGGNEIVLRYTLLEFAYGTAVAAGQVMEFYVNYGFVGVTVGFAILGLIFAWVDSKIAFHLKRDNAFKFLRWYLVGIAFLKPLDDLTVMTASAASAFVTAILLEQALKWWFGRQSRLQLQTPGGATSAPALAPPRR